MPKIHLKFAASLFLLAPFCMGSPTYYLATGQTGAQTQIDTAHTSTWLFTPNTDFSFGGGLFDMKAGQSVVDDLVISIYQGTDATGTLLDSLTLTSTVFCGQVANCGQYNYHQFFLPTAVPLTTGTSYFVALTSQAPNTQSLAYFIKSDTFFVSDANANPIVPSPIGTPTGSPVPEPSTLTLGSLSLA